MQRRLITLNVHVNAMSSFDYTDYFTPYFKYLSNVVKGYSSVIM